MRHKAILIFFGIIFSIILIEISLRLGGFIFLSLQEFRNRAAIYKKNTYRIMCLGESTTFGGSDSYPAQLEEILNQRNIGIRFSVINKGMPAVNTNAIVSQLEAELNKYQPDMVTAMIGINDKYIRYYEDMREVNPVLFNKFRTYRFGRILWMHVVNRLKKAGVEKQVDKEDSELEPATLFKSRERFAQQIKTAESGIQSGEAIRKSIEPNPKDEKAYIELGLFYREQGRHGQAEQAFKKAIEINPADYRAYIELGHTYRDGAKRAQSEEVFKKAIEINPADYRAYIELGWSYRDPYNPDPEKYDKAALVFAKALEINPKYFVASRELGWCYMYQGKFVQAEQAFKKTIEINPEDDRVYAGLALLYEEVGKPELAQNCYKKIKTIRSEFYSPMTKYNYLNLRRILNKKGIKLVCLQYPMRSIETLKKIFEGQDGVIFVDNAYIFKDAVKKDGFEEYFRDMFAGDFGHCTYKGNKLLAENIANVILKECFNK